MTAKIIDGRAISLQLREQLKTYVSSCRERGFRSPVLAVILVGNDPASRIYVDLKMKACQSIGVISKDFIFDENVSQEELKHCLQSLNDDPEVDAILMQLPLPSHLNAQSLIECIAPEKDVDGLTCVNQGALNWQKDGVVPCTPLGVMKLLESTGVNLEGKFAAVVGRSVLVGAPMATLLSNAGATVVSLHSQTVDCPSITSKADILVVATGVHHLVRANWVKPGAIVVDVGIHRVNDKIEGDVDFAQVAPIASYITPVPKGVGPMTITMLLANCVEAFAKRFNLENFKLNL